MSRTLSQIVADRSPISTSINRAITTADAGRLFRVTGTTTLTLPLASTVSPGWATGEIHNSGTGIITVAASGTDPLEGVAGGTLQIFPRQKAYVFYDTDGWRIAWLERQPIVSAVAISAPVASVAMALPLGYGAFDFTIAGLSLSVAQTYVGYRLSWDGGTTFKSGSGEYGAYLHYGNSGTPGTTGTASTVTRAANSYGEMAPNAALGTTYNTTLTMKGVITPGFAGIRANIQHTNTTVDNNGTVVIINYTGYPQTQGTANAIQFMLDRVANMNTGSFSIRGIPAP